MEKLTEELQRQSLIIENSSLRISQLQSSSVSAGQERELALLRHRIAELETDFMLERKEQEACRDKIQDLYQENDELKRRIEKIEKNFVLGQKEQEFNKEEMKKMYHENSELNSQMANLYNKFLFASQRVEALDQENMNLKSRFEDEIFRLKAEIKKLSEVSQSKIKGLAKWDYSGTDHGDLSFKKGDIISDIVLVNNGWWKGKTQNGESGIFPGEFYFIG
ncbi:11026_t:CDS:1 [Acaulospora colombiana]|uniref:11026_t:CDS:1 n=1 Tax=Acaulospora colombiana TaxID=27376 RepID=A0ACA9KHF5_9GLOM|nr:11026_t:CDS:1 [Acaulospora colombiana]